MFLNKVEICGVNTSELPLLSDEEKDVLERIYLKWKIYSYKLNREIWMPENNM